MLATTTTDALALADPLMLKRAPSSISSCLNLLEVPISSSWTPDNTFLFIASTETIQKYDPSHNMLRNVHTHEERISCIVARTSNSVIFSAGNQIHVLEDDQITQTFRSHKGHITSLSLSTDNSLLASTSIGAVHVHNLSLGSHSVMRGLSNVETSTSTFDLHTRTRLLVASGRQLFIFDTTRPSGPMKTVPLNGSAAGDVIAVACSPFSKTLVAVATSGGSVGLVDLEKDKSLIRTISVNEPLTTTAFSPEGGAIYLGTKTGKILVVELRALDRTAKAITISETGCPVQTISIQKKTVMKTPMATKKPTTEAPPSRRMPSVKSVTSPSRKVTTPPSPAGRRTASTVSPSKRTTDAKKVLSPTRDPHGNSKVSIGKAPTKFLNSPEKRSSSTSNSNKVVQDVENPRRPRTLPSATSASTALSRKISTSSVAALSLPRTSPQRRPRAASSASRVSGKEPLPVSPARLSSRPSSSASRATQRTKTPSPGIPEIHAEPVTPVPASKQRKTDMGVLGLGTPEVDRWVRAGAEDTRDKGKGKTVGFRDDDEATERALVAERERVLSMQISPRRPAISSSTSTNSWNRSPPLDTSLSANAGTSETPAGGGSAHDLLRTIVQDVMFDFQQETKADMMGLHLDLLRMGRGWKMELRALMDEYVGDLRDLREENQRLRLENERLRRGSY